MRKLMHHMLTTDGVILKLHGRAHVVSALGSMIFMMYTHDCVAGRYNCTVRLTFAIKIPRRRLISAISGGAISPLI